MNPCQQLHQLGQSLWLDNITRDLLTSGTLKKYINDLSVTGLTSNPTIFDEAIAKSSAYDGAIANLSGTQPVDEALFMELALDDLRQAADLFKPVYDQTNGVDGWVSMEVSPLLAYDTASTTRAAQSIFESAQRENLFVKIPGTPAGVAAIEECIFAGIPVNVTLLFSREQYLASAEAYMRGIERRIKAGFNPLVTSVASVFISRWDRAVADKVPAELQNKLGIAISQRIYAAYNELRASARFQKLAALGATTQRLLWASTGVKDPKASQTLYIEALAAPNTINTMPEKTLLAFAEHGQLRGSMKDDSTEGEKMLMEFKKSGVDIDALAAQLQREGAEAFVKSWQQLLKRIAEKRASIGKSTS
ncbi:MAG TPA: transaldolase [Steroidobacteraceae bacterium]|nr:transaldolase [Steroidobacteraceae bacterium]